MLGFVYLWTNIINGKRYIGSHVGSLSDGYMGSGILFSQAVKKYGKENFVRTILHEEYGTVESLREKELEIINDFNACNDERYYNLRTHATHEKTGPKFTEEAKAKISESRKRFYENHENRLKHSNTMKEKWKSVDYREKRERAMKSERYIELVRSNNLGNKNPMYGKSMSMDNKKKLSERNAGSGNPFWGKKHTPESLDKMKKNIKKKYGKDNSSSVKIEINSVIYDTIKDAMKMTGLSYKKINKLGRRIYENN